MIGEIATSVLDAIQRSPVRFAAIKHLVLYRSTPDHRGLLAGAAPRAMHPKSWRPTT